MSLRIPIYRDSLSRPFGMAIFKPKATLQLNLSNLHYYRLLNQSSFVLITLLFFFLLNDVIAKLFQVKIFSINKYCDIRWRLLRSFLPRND